MSRNQRLGLIAAAVVVLAAAFVLIRPTEEEKQEPARAPRQPTTQTETQTAEAKPRPVPAVDIRDGRPSGGLKTIEFTSGDSARIDVTSDKPAEVHLHGYDIEQPVQPGKTTTVRFKADIDGVFELEDHGSGEELASVKVTPR